MGRCTWHCMVEQNLSRPTGRLFCYLELLKRHSMNRYGLLRTTEGAVGKARLAALEWKTLASSPQLLGLVIIVVIIVLLSRAG